MGFQLVAYSLLKQHIKESIVTEIRRYGFDAKDMRKGLRKLSKGHPDRAMQCRYLHTIIDCLDNSKKDSVEQARILNAAAFYIRQKVDESYQKGIVTPFLLLPDRSTLYNSLTTSLNLTTDNFPSSQDLLALYVPLGDFMQSKVYVDSDPKKGYLPKEQQPFSEEKIKGYKVEVSLKDLLGKVAELRKKQIDKTLEEHTKEAVKKAGAGHLGLFTRNVNCETEDEYRYFNCGM